MDKICENCKHWRMKDNKITGICGSSGFEYNTLPEEKSKNNNKLYYWDFECWDAGFETEPKFGCIHFEVSD